MTWQPISTAPTTDGAEYLVRGGRLCNDLGSINDEYGMAHILYTPPPDWLVTDEDEEGFEPHYPHHLRHRCYYAVWVENPTEWHPLPEKET